MVLVVKSSQTFLSRMTGLLTKYDNYTLYGIHSKTDRQLLSVYCSLVFLSSLIGDTLILVGSLCYRAIRLHRLLVVFIQYMALFALVMIVYLYLLTAGYLEIFSVV